MHTAGAPRGDVTAENDNSLICKLTYGARSFLFTGDTTDANLEAAERKGWIDYRAIPMGGNIQLVFYRSNAQDDDVLVKVLLNENEATLPVKTKTAPYYKWSDVRKYYLEELDAYQP